MKLVLQCLLLVPLLVLLTMGAIITLLMLQVLRLNTPTLCDRHGSGAVGRK